MVDFLQTLIYSLIQGLLLLGIPVVIVLLLTYINRNTKSNLANTFGINSQIYLGWFGIVIHELSHLIVAIIAGHHIESFRLICSPREVRTNGGRLGYVNESYNPKSLYQKIGTCFIGTAPIWGCTLVVYLLLLLSEPKLVWQLQYFSTQIGEGNFKIAFLSLLTTSCFQYDSNSAKLFAFIGLFLLISAIVGGFDLSHADMQNSIAGFVLLYMIVAVLILLFNLLDLGENINIFINRIIFMFSNVMSVSLILSILINLLSKVLRIVF